MARRRAPSNEAAVGSRSLDGLARPRRPLGVVLAGGASRRMGQDKATLVLNGLTLVERAVRLLDEVCPEVLVADGGRQLLSRRISVVDGPGHGPAAGILGAAAARPGEPLLVLACDLPRVPAALLQELARPGPWDWTVPRCQGRLEPLCALYGQAGVRALADLVAAGQWALHPLAASSLKIRYLEDEVLRRFGDPEIIFLNLNVPADLRRYRSPHSD